MLLKKLIEDGELTGELKNVEAGTCLFEPGIINTTLFYLVKGSAKLIKSNGALQIIQAGTLLGLPDLMRKNYTGTAITLEPAEVLLITKEELQQALQLNAALRLYLIQQLSRNNTLTSTFFE
ncbi:cyclic nucleotide-binding domain-containing protein [Pontibacter sp. H259]|uniref:Crp/Fnr family transcriptional regulator n=1 Tax=Pontibacter sp. H259 TaxID=3133421 RepID=UPI0030BB6A14